MKVAWLIQGLVPYHHFRFEAFSRHGGVDGVLIQLTDRDAFRVLMFKPESSSYRLLTLFPGVDAKKLSLKDIVARLFAVLRSENPDVLCVSGFGIQSGQAMLAAVAEFRLPGIVLSESNRYDFPRHFISEWFKRIMISSCSAALVGGREAAAYMAELGIPREGIFHGYDVVDNSHFIDSGAHDFSAPYFFACARMEEKKNFFRLIDAYAQYCRLIGDRAWRLQIAGDGELRPQIEKQIADLGLIGKVELLGAVNFAEIAEHYRHAGVFVHASTTEQWGLVVNEAMAAGCPLLVSKRCGCAADLVQPGKNGETFNPFSVDELTQKLVRFSTLTPDELQRMGKCSERIIADWGPERFATGLNSAIEYARKHPRRAGWLNKLAIKILMWREHSQHEQP